MPSLKDIHLVDPSAPAASVDRIEKVFNRLLNRKDGRPRTLKTLTAFIKGQLNAQATEPAVNDVLARLKEAGMSVSAEGKVTYPRASNLV